MRLGVLLIIIFFPAIGFSAEVLKVSPAQGVVFVKATLQEQESLLQGKAKKMMFYNTRTKGEFLGTFVKKLERAIVIKFETVEQFEEGDELTLKEQEDETLNEEQQFTPLSFKQLSLHSPFYLAPVQLATKTPQQLGLGLAFHKYNQDMDFEGEHYFKRLSGHKLGLYTVISDSHLKFSALIHYELEQLQGDANLFGAEGDLMVSHSKGGFAFALPVKKQLFIGLSFAPHSVLLEGSVYEFRKHLFYWNEVSFSFFKKLKPYYLGIAYTPGYSLVREDDDNNVYSEKGDELKFFASWPKSKKIALYGSISYWLNTVKLGSNPNNSAKNAYGLLVGSRYQVSGKFQLETALKMNSNHYYTINRFTDESKLAYRSLYFSLLSPVFDLGTLGVALTIKTGDESEDGDDGISKISSNQWKLAFYSALKF